jgi:uncharacterized protein YcfJ
MNTAARTALAICATAVTTNVAAQVVLYENDNFNGRSYTADKQVGDFARVGFNDRASSIVVLRDRWEACEDSRFRGRCIVLRPGRYPSLAAMGLNDRVSSLRMVGNSARVDSARYAPEPIPVYDNHRRNNEKLYEANVTSVHAVVGPAQQRCWVEHEQVSDGRGDANVPGAVVGALIGGVLGHQVGSGRGNDVATAGGAVAGGLVGANVGRGNNQTHTQDVQRCSTAPSQAQADYWDVTYDFRGQQHRMQATSPPGRTITVNAQGEPRA